MDPDTAMQSDVRSGRQVSGSMADDRGERARAEGLTNGPSQGAELAQARRLLDYEQSVAQVRQLTDVRFKLVAFVPTLTAAVVALLGTSNVDALTRAVLAAGGLSFTFGLVLYDLRNSQLYNSAIGRATELERVLFEPYGGDEYPGLFGSRADTNRRIEVDHRHTFTLFFDRLHLDVRHAPALALVYATVAGSWAWVLLDAAGTGVQDLTEDADHGWQAAVHDYIPVLPVVLAAAFATWFYREHLRHD